MTRAKLLSLAAYGTVAGAILAGCAPSPEQAAADNSAAANSASNGTNAIDAANSAVTPSTPANDANSGTNATGTTAQANDTEGGSGSASSANRKPMIPFKMVSTKGETLTNESLKGKVVLLDFWATWCGPCKQASPTMEKLHKTYAKQGLVVVGANALENSPAAVKNAPAEYQKEHGYTYTFTKDNTALATELGVEGIPYFIFIDKKGNVGQVATGFSPSTTPSEFEAKVKELLAESA